MDLQTLVTRKSQAHTWELGFLPLMLDNTPLEESEYLHKHGAWGL